MKSNSGITRKRYHNADRLQIESLEDRVMMSVKFVFDYSLDTNGFFASQTRRDLLSYAGLMVTAQLTDKLSAITPSGSNTWTANITHPGTGASLSIFNKSLPADVILVYAGGRNIDQLGTAGSAGFSSRGTSSWQATVKGRGQPGALLTSPSDTAPKIASVTFDTSGPKWHFGKTSIGLDSTETDFVSIAMHELGHVLGISKPATVNSWSRLIQNGRFIGSKTTAENGGVSPPASGAHFGEGVRSDGIEVAMDPTLRTGTRKFFSELDFTALDDIGWDRSSSNDSIFLARHQLTHYVGTNRTDSVTFGGAIGNGLLIDPLGGLDVDIYRVWGQQGTVLSAAVARPSNATTSLDYYIRLFNASGAAVTYGDQGGIGETDSLSYTLPRSDYYYVGVSSYANRGYSPTSVYSGPGGPRGPYLLSITMRDRSFLTASIRAADAVSDGARSAPSSSGGSLEYLGPTKDQATATVVLHEPATIGESETNDIQSPQRRGLLNDPMPVKPASYTRSLPVDTKLSDMIFAGPPAQPFAFKVVNLSAQFLMELAAARRETLTRSSAIM